MTYLPLPSLSRRRSALLLAGLALVHTASALPATLNSQIRYYRADAVITILSIPIVTKSGVGSGYASVEEHGENGRQRLELRFAAGSLPECAHGLNRLGYIEEAVVQRDARPVRSEYFGFMTTSEERSVNEARRALRRNTAKCTPYSVMLGSFGDGRTDFRKTRFCAEGAYSWTNWSGLDGQARRAAMEPQAAARTPDTPQRSEGVPVPMLYSLFRAIRAGSAPADSKFVWGDRRYCLAVSREPDTDMGSRLASRGVTVHPERVIRLAGIIRPDGGRKKTKFRLWYEDGAENPLPLRIEYRPRSFLHLIFEASSDESLASAGRAVNSAPGRTE